LARRVARSISADASSLRVSSASTGVES
jgi:hypothetical protein